MFNDRRLLVPALDVSGNPFTAHSIKMGGVPLTSHDSSSKDPDGKVWLLGPVTIAVGMSTVSNAFLLWTSTPAKGPD